MKEVKTVKVGLTTFEVSAGPVRNIRADLRLNTSEMNRVASTRLLIGEQGEILISPVACWCGLTGCTEANANNWCNRNIGREQCAVYPHQWKEDGSPNWRYRTSFVQSNCMLQALEATRLDPRVHQLYKEFLDRIIQDAKKLDRVGSEEAGIAPNELRCLYSQAKDSKKAEPCLSAEQQAVKTEVAAIAEDAQSELPETEDIKSEPDLELTKAEPVLEEVVEDPFKDKQQAVQVQIQDAVSIPRSVVEFAAWRINKRKKLDKILHSVHALYNTDMTGMQPEQQLALNAQLCNDLLESIASLVDA